MLKAYNGDCDLLIYNCIIWDHILILKSEVTFPKFYLSFQSAEKVSLDSDLLWKNKNRSLMPP